MDPQASAAFSPNDDSPFEISITDAKNDRNRDIRARERTRRQEGTIVKKGQGIEATPAGDSHRLERTTHAPHPTRGRRLDLTHSTIYGRSDG